MRFLLDLHFIFDLHVEVLHSIFDVLSSFIDAFHFAVVSSFVVVHLHFLFDVIPHPSVDYRRGFYIPFFTFSSAHCRLIRDTFILNNSILPRALRP